MTLGFDIQEVLIHLGVWTAFAIIFAESGLLIGFFLPGDSLIFTAGLLASQGYFPLWLLIIGGSVAAILGDNFGYYFGKRYGHKIFNREESFFFHKDHVKRAEEFFKKHGPITIILARFTPVVRTFAPILAGVGKMDYKTFFFYNVTGGIFWIVSLSVLGFYAGKYIPDIDKYIFPIIGVIIIASIIPGIIGFIKSKSRKS